MTDAAQQIQNGDGSWHQLDNWTVIHVLRNPSGWTEEAVRACRLFAADVLDECAKRALAGRPQRAKDAYRARTEGKDAP